MVVLSKMIPMRKMRADYIAIKLDKNFGSDVVD